VAWEKARPRIKNLCDECLAAAILEACLNLSSQIECIEVTAGRCWMDPAGRLQIEKDGLRFRSQLERAMRVLEQKGGKKILDPVGIEVARRC